MKDVSCESKTAPFPSARPEPQRFTVDGSTELEAHLNRTCARILTGVRSIVPAKKLECLMLGGGYGRGEGGVLRTETGDQPYNDLEFYICIRGNRFLNRRQYDQAFHNLGVTLSPVAGVELEFKIISLDYLRRSPPSMFFYDLVSGHRWLCGDDSLLVGCEHHREAARIPVFEATRLLMNRCSGLLFARERMQADHFTPDDADFVARNIAKAKLALGDAVLTALGRYHWSCRARDEQLGEMAVGGNPPWISAVRRFHAEGVEFKMHPHQGVTRADLLWKKYEPIAAAALDVWLWLEARRLGQSFGSVRDYVLHPANKCPDSIPWRNHLLNARAFGVPGVFQRRHPAEKILESLAALLWDDPENGARLADAALPGFATRTPGDGSIEAYRQMWMHVR